MAHIRLDTDVSFLTREEVVVEVLGIESVPGARDGRLRVRVAVVPPAHLERGGEVIEAVDIGVLLGRDGRWVAAAVAEGTFRADVWRIDENGRQEVFEGPDAQVRATARAAELAREGKQGVRAMAHPAGWQVVWQEGEPKVRFVPRVAITRDGQPLSRRHTVLLARAVGALALKTVSGVSIEEEGQGCTSCLFHRFVRYHRPEREAVDEGSDKEAGALVAADGTPSTGWPLRHLCTATLEWLDRKAAEVAATVPSRQAQAAYERAVARDLAPPCPIRAWVSREVGFAAAWQPVLPTGAVQSKEIRVGNLRVVLALGKPAPDLSGVIPVGPQAKKEEARRELPLLAKVATWLAVLAVKGRWPAGKPLPVVGGLQVVELAMRLGTGNRIAKVRAEGEVEGRPVLIVGWPDDQEPDRKGTAWVNIFRPDAPRPLRPMEAAVRQGIGVVVHEDVVFVNRYDGQGNRPVPLGRITLEELRRLGQAQQA